MAGAIVQEKALDVQRGIQGEDDSQCSAWTAGVGSGSQAKKGKRGVDVGNWLQQSDVRADPPARVSLGKYALGYGKFRLKAHPALPGAHPPGTIRWGMSSPCLAGGLWCTWYAWEPCPPRVSTSALLLQ